MATIFGRNGHHQAISQKLKKTLVHIVQKRQFIWDPIYIYINIFINSFKIINSLKMCSL
jgi:hypothetical protein